MRHLRRVATARSVQRNYNHAQGLKQCGPYFFFLMASEVRLLSRTACYRLSGSSRFNHMASPCTSHVQVRVASLLAYLGRFGTGSTWIGPSYLHVALASIIATVALTWGRRWLEFLSSCSYSVGIHLIGLGPSLYEVHLCHWSEVE